MRILLDSQAFIYAVLPQHQHQLPPKAREVIADPANDRFLSVLSVAEIAMKIAKKKLAFTQAQIQLGLKDLAVELLPVKEPHVLRTFKMPLHHSDPIDRMIIAAALEENMPLIGGDGEFAKYRGLKVIWK